MSRGAELSGVFILCFLLSSAGAAKEMPWEQVYVNDGVTVFKQAVPKSSLFVFKGVGEINAPIGKVVSVLRDTSRKAEWVDRVVELRQLKEFGNADRLEYFHVSFPWPLQDRDFVYRAKIEISKPEKRIIFTSISMKDPAGPVVSGVVRGHISRASIILTPSEDGKRTYAIGEAHMDPRGAIPAWLVNMVQKDWPYNTFINVRRQAAKPDIVEDPAVADFFD